MDDDASGRAPNATAASTQAEAPRPAPREAARIDRHEAAASSIATPVPERIGERFEILGLLGMGGMGSVYRVRDRELDEIVALKFLRRDLTDAPAMLERFRQEVKLARRVTHLNVARTFDIGEHEGERFLTMELIDGESLAKRLLRDGPMSSRVAVDVALAICAGLGAAHAAGVVHRDLKPDNVMLARDGRTVITDFGIARRHRGPSQTAGIVGTAAYMAPEQVDGMPDVDARADLYALGAVLYEMLTGTPAWPGESFLAVALARTREPPPDPRARNVAITAELASVVLRCLARDRDERFASARELAAALGAVRDGAASDELPPVELAALHARANRVAPALAAGDKTIAVLPFTSTSGEPRDAFLADALTDDLIDALSMTHGLRVRPRSLVALHQTRGGSDPRALGRALDVQVIVDGSFRRHGDDVRISARLISVTDAFQIWAKRFERSARDVLAINDEVARAVADALTVDLARAPRDAALDGEAVELYLRARRALRETWSGFGDPSQAVELFERALARSHDDPDLLAGYAMACARRLNYSPATVDDPVRVQAIADRAIERAPELGEAWLARASVLYITGEWPGAVVALRKALARAPGLPKAHEMLAAILLEVGRLDDGMYRLESVLSVDPTNAGARWELARGAALAGRWERADALLALPVHGGSELAGRLVSRARLNLWRGNPRHDVTGRTGTRSDFMVDHYTAALETRRPLTTVADIEADVATVRPGSRFLPLVRQFIAEIAVASDEPEVALDQIARAVDVGLFDLAWLDRCPVLDRVRDDPRFVALRARVAERVAQVEAALDGPLGID